MKFLKAGHILIALSMVVRIAFPLMDLNRYQAMLVDLLASLLVWAGWIVVGLVIRRELVR